MKTCPFCAEEIQDAAIVCKHCGRDLFGKATQPVVKVRSADWVSTTAKWGVGVFLLLLLIGFFAGNDRVPPTPSTTVTLAADVKFNGLIFTIRNPEARTWTNGKAEINGPLSGYEYQFGDLLPGKDITVPAREFTKSGGQRFDPLALKPQSFIVYADVNASGTRGIWQGGWK